MARRERTFFFLYWGVVGLFALVLGWWIYFFSIQGDLLIERMQAAGVELTPRQSEAVEAATHDSLRMLLFEGAFLVLMLLAGVLIALRAMRREMQLSHQQKELLSAVSHELRSPITSARLHLESLQLGRVPEQKREQYLETARLDLERLSAMVDRLLEAARMTSGLPELVLQRMDLAEYVKKSVDKIVKRHAGEPIQVELAASDPVLVEADAAALETILRNLIANSIKYGGESPRLRVSVSCEAQRALLEVRDFGPGLQDIDAEQALKPFTRGGDARVRSRPGVGLGLYLVGQLTRALGGRLRAENAADGHGFSVRIALPLAPEGEA